MEGELKKLGKYQIQSILGRGAMGVVYKGFDPVIERIVAIKTMRRFDDHDEAAREAEERFVREAKAAGRLSHPAIVGVYDFGEDGDTAFIVMEYVEGKTLKEYLEARHPFTMDEIVDVMSKVLSALEYSHRLEVVHRDIKPGNIIVTSNGEVKIMDFGIAKIESSTMTQAGTIMGTPSYMSPEQVLGGAVDRRSDIFSAGAVLYELLAQQKAFSGPFAAVMQQVVNVDPPPASGIRPSVPSAFDGVVRKALAKAPDDRYQSAAEFAGVLAAVNCQASATIAAAEDGTVVAMASKAGDDWALGAAPSSPPPLPKVAVTAKPRGGLIAGGGIAAAVALAGLGWWLMAPPAQLAVEKAPAPPAPTQVAVPAPVVEAPIRVPAVSVVTDRGDAPTYRMGETVSIFATVSADAHVWCFYHQASGEVFRLFPNDYAPNSRLRAGEPLQIPGNAPFQIRFDVPNSKEGVGCVATVEDFATLVPPIAQAPALSALPFPDLLSLIKVVQERAGGKAGSSVVEIKVKK